MIYKCPFFSEQSSQVNNNKFIFLNAPINEYMKTSSIKKKGKIVTILYKRFLFNSNLRCSGSFINLEVKMEILKLICTTINFLVFSLNIYYVFAK